MQALELPYRVVAVCTGDLGLGQVFKYDIEAWMPSRANFGETHSCSNFHDFQARRLNIKYKDHERKKHFVHTLNNTAIASPRILIPFLENHQLADGSIYLPPSLRPYLGGVDKLLFAQTK
jgi:seryl-tRNA synthetase